MKPTQQLHDLGQSLWLDNITRDMLDDGTLQRYIRELSVTGLTSNPTIFDEAISKGRVYEKSIREKASRKLNNESIFFELAIEDLQRAADLFEPVFERTQEVDGWVSMEVSPLLASDTQGTVRSAQEIWTLAERKNLYVKIPGTAQGLPAIEEATFLGIPVNVTLLFSREQYLAAATSYMKGLERRLQTKQPLDVSSVASVFISRWDRAVADKVPKELQMQLGIAMGKRCYRAYRELIASPRWQKLAAAGARPQRLLFASTGVKDPQASQTLYVEAFAAPDTVDTMPEKTLLALASKGKIGDVIPEDGGNAEEILKKFKDAGIDVEALAAQLQTEGAQSFVKSWGSLMQAIADQSRAAAKAS